MTQHIDDILVEWLSGAVTEEQEDRLDTHVASCTRCAAKLEAARQDFAHLAAGLTPVAPSDELRAHILDAARPEARFVDLADQVASLMDVSQERALERLAEIDDEQSWEAGPFPNIDLFHLDGGAAVRDAIVGFVRIAPGATFPEHEHLGTETVLVLQGAYRDSDGVVYRRGEQNIKASGTSHDFEALDGPPLIYLVVAFEGVAIGEMILGPGDARM